MTSPTIHPEPDSTVSLQLSTVPEPGGLRIVVAGEIDLATVEQLREALIAATSDGARRVVVDLEAVTYLDSSGLGALVGAHQRLTSLGGGLVVRCTDAWTRRLFTITGLDKVFSFEDPA